MFHNSAATFFDALGTESLILKRADTTYDEAMVRGVQLASTCLLQEGEKARVEVDPVEARWLRPHGGQPR